MLNPVRGFVFGDSQSVEGFDASHTRNWYDALGARVDNVYANTGATMSHFLNGFNDSPHQGKGITEFLSENLNADVAWFFCGGNDILNGLFNSQAAADAGVASMIADFDSIVTECNVAGVKLIVGITPPGSQGGTWAVGVTNGWGAYYESAYDAWVQHLLDGHAAGKFIYADTRDRMEASGYAMQTAHILSPTNIHFNDVGRGLLGWYMLQETQRFEFWTDEARTVVERYPNATRDEQDAIARFVNHLVDAGNYSYLVEAFPFALSDDADQLQGIMGNLATTNSTVTNVGANGVRFDTTSAYVDTGIVPFDDLTADGGKACHGILMTSVPDVSAEDWFTYYGAAQPGSFGFFLNGFRFRDSANAHQYSVNCPGQASGAGELNAPVSGKLIQVVRDSSAPCDMQVYINGSVAASQDDVGLSQTTQAATDPILINALNQDGVNGNDDTGAQCAFWFIAQEGYNPTSFLAAVTRLLRDLGTL